MTYAYIRQIPNFPTLGMQQRDILGFIMERDISIDKEVIEYASKNLILDERKEFENFLQTMIDGNVVMVSDLSILSDRPEELIKIITCMLSHNVNLHVVNSTLLINRETQMIEIFPLLNTLRKEESEKINHIGRPKGSKSTSKFDIYQKDIITMLGQNMNVSAIARKLEVSRSSLKDYIESRGLKELVKSVWNQMKKSETIGDIENIVVVCPFEEATRLKEEWERENLIDI